MNGYYTANGESASHAGGKYHPGGAPARPTAPPQYLGEEYGPGGYPPGPYHAHMYGPAHGAAVPYDGSPSQQMAAHHGGVLPMGMHSPMPMMPPHHPYHYPHMGGQPLSVHCTGSNKSKGAYNGLRRSIDKQRSSIERH